MVEVLRDRSLGIPPFGLAEARAMIERTRGSRLLTGFRGRPPADIDALAAMLVAVGNLAVDGADRIEALDVNPVLALPEGRGAVAVDALLIRKSTQSEAGGNES
jgi:hypothetical protein